MVYDQKIAVVLVIEFFVRHFSDFRGHSDSNASRQDTKKNKRPFTTSILEEKITSE
jgi:hypothetical protein